MSDNGSHVLRPYILVMRDHSYRLIGPFDTPDAASEWASHPTNNPDDDPRWQRLMLASDDIMPTLETPPQP